jgi:hypothetical protein
MARDASEYKRIGRWVASRKTGSAIFDLYPELVSFLRCPPAEGNLRNAVQHMWGYVSQYASHPGNIHTNLQSKVYRGGKEEATQAYYNIRRRADDAANKGRRMNANWYLKEIQRLVFLHDVIYLKESTALSELQAWMR